ncbi:hypothetical protein, partial [Paenibacillus alba]
TGTGTGQQQNLSCPRVGLLLKEQLFLFGCSFDSLSHSNLNTGSVGKLPVLTGKCSLKSGDMFVK